MSIESGCRGKRGRGDAETETEPSPLHRSPSCPSGTPKPMKRRGTLNFVIPAVLLSRNPVSFRSRGGEVKTAAAREGHGDKTLAASLPDLSMTSLPIRLLALAFLSLTGPCPASVVKASPGRLQYGSKSGFIWSILSADL